MLRLTTSRIANFKGPSRLAVIYPSNVLCLLWPGTASCQTRITIHVENLVCTSNSRGFLHSCSRNRRVPKHWKQQKDSKLHLKKIAEIECVKEPMDEWPMNATIIANADAYCFLVKSHPQGVQIRIRFHAHCQTYNQFRQKINPKHCIICFNIREEFT